MSPGHNSVDFGGPFRPTTISCSSTDSPQCSRFWGCTIFCHRGQGPATEVAEAHHETTLAWEQPILPAHYLQASCGSCHQADIKETPQLTRGRELLSRLNCQACHKLSNIDRSALRADRRSRGNTVADTADFNLRHGNRCQDKDIDKNEKLLFHRPGAFRWDSVKGRRNLYLLLMRALHRFNYLFPHPALLPLTGEGVE